MTDLSIGIGKATLGSLASDTEKLNQWSAAAKRFANPAFASHAQRELVQNATISLTGDVVADVIKALNAATAHDRQAHLMPDIPQLKAPQASAGDESKLSASARLGSLLMQMSQLVNESSIGGLMTKLQAFSALLNGNLAEYNRLADSLELVSDQWGNDYVALTEAKKQADGLNQQVNRDQAALTDAEKTLAELQKQADQQKQQTGSVTPELQARLDKAQGIVISARNNLNNSQQVYNNFVSTTLEPATKAEQSSRATMEQCRQEADNLLKSMSPHTLKSAEVERGSLDRKTLTFLMALIAQLINESASDQLESAAKLKQVQSQAAMKDAEKKAKEYEEEVRKAEEMEKTMGCIGKIFGWLITAVSFVAAAFTGGASLAFAAVGLALAVGDEISQAVSGFSFMQEALKPIMDGIIKPLMELLGNMFADILKAFGVDEATAQQIGQILGAVVAAVALIAAVVVAGSAMSKLATKMMDALKNVMGDTLRNIMRKLMNSAVGQMLKRLSSGMGKSMGMSEVKTAQYVNRLQKVELGAGLGKSAVIMAGDIVTAQMLVEAKKIEAKLFENQVLQELLNQMLETAVNSFKSMMSTVNTVVEELSDVAEKQYQAGHYITSNMAKAAG